MIERNSEVAEKEELTAMIKKPTEEPIRNGLEKKEDMEVMSW